MRELIGSLVFCNFFVYFVCFWLKLSSNSGILCKNEQFKGEMRNDEIIRNSRNDE